MSDLPSSAPALYENLCRIPNISSASFNQNNPANNSSSVIEASFTVKDVPNNGLRKFALTFASNDKQWTRMSKAAFLNENVLGRTSSENGEFEAVVRKSSGDAGKDTEILEIWNANGNLLYALKLSKFCGNFISGQPFGGMMFSKDCENLAFVAEEKPQENVSFWKEKKENTESNPPNVSPGYEYDLKEDFGEQLSKSLKPRVFILNVRTKAVEQVDVSRCFDGNSEEFDAAGQPIWVPGEKILVFVGWIRKISQRKLGLIYYSTRRSCLFAWNIEQDLIVKLTPDEREDWSPNSPRFSPDGSKLLYCTTQPVWFHNSCAKIRAICWEAGVEKSFSSPFTVLDIVRSQNLEPSSFQGLWGTLNKKIWLSDNIHFVFSTPSGCLETIFVANFDTKSIVSCISPPADFPGTLPSMTILDIEKGSNVLLVKVSSLDCPPMLYTCAGILDDSITWSIVYSCADPSWISANDSKFSVERVQVETSTGPKFVIEALAIRPTDSGIHRLIVWPHGGPHSGFTSAFSTSVLFLTSLGFTCLLINFRGSTGYGQDFLECLPGHIGDYDVEDCISLMEHFLKLHPDISSKDNVVAMGGSHSGFLVLSLIGKFPSLFKSAVARNPVSNIAHMYSCTDIQDWCAIESGISIDYSGELVPSPADYASMYQISPISFVSNVQTPLLLMLGDQDRRVPMSQAIDYFKVLKARQVRTRCLVYPGNQHALSDKIDTEADMWVNVALWLSE